MNVIGLSGFAGAGKSSVAEYLVNVHGYTRLSFAAPLKNMLRTLDPVVGSKLTLAYGNGYVAKPVRLSDLTRFHTEQEIKDGPYGKEYRRLLQVLGTDCIRAHDEHFWVNAASAQMTDEDGKYVFDDVRFPNEAEVIKEYNEFGLWHISRPGFEAVNGHTSEAHAGKMGEAYSIINDTDLERLHSGIEVALLDTFTVDAQVLV